MTNVSVSEICLKLLTVMLLLISLNSFVVIAYCSTCLYVFLSFCLTLLSINFMIPCTYLLISITFLFIFFTYLLKSYRSLIALILPVIFFIFCYFLSIIVCTQTFKALNGLLYAAVPLRNYSLKCNVGNRRVFDEDLKINFVSSY